MKRIWKILFMLTLSAFAQASPYTPHMSALKLKAQSNWMKRIHLSGYTRMFFHQTRYKAYGFYAGNTSTTSYDNVPGTYAAGTEKLKGLMISDASLFLDAKINPSFKAHFNLHHSIGDILTLSTGARANLIRITSSSNSPNYPAQISAQVASALTNSDYESSLALDEGFLSYYNPKKSPIFLKVGRMFSPFSDIEDPYNPLPSLTHALVKDTIDGITIGLADRSHWHGSAWFFRDPYHDTASKNFNQWGARLQYDGLFHQMHVQLNTSYLNDARTFNVAHGVSQYFIAPIPITSSVYKRADAWDMHLHLMWHQFKGMVGYTAVLKDMANQSTAQIFQEATTHSNLPYQLIYSVQPKIWSFKLGYDFNGLNHDQNITLNYEKANKKGGAMLIIEKHLGVDYTISLHKNIDGFARYHAYFQQQNIGWNYGLVGLDGDITGYSTSRPILRTWMLGLKVHF